MSVVRTYSGSLLLDPDFGQRLSGDAQGGPQLPDLRLLQQWDHDGGDDPHFGGWLYGSLTIAAGGDLLLAHATDPLQGFGDALYSDGLTVAGKKLKLLYVRNTHASANFTLKRATANGLPVFDDADSGVTLSPGGIFLWTDPGGDAIGALTTGSNDALSLALPGTASSAVLLAVYGS